MDLHYKQDINSIKYIFVWICHHYYLLLLYIHIALIEFSTIFHVMLAMYSTLQVFSPWIRPFYCNVLHWYEEEATPPRSATWAIYRSASHTFGAVDLVIICLHSNTSLSSHTLSGRSMVVGHIPMAHMCPFVCIYNIGMTVHTLAILWAGHHSRNLLYAHPTSLSTSGSGTQQGIAWSQITLT